MTWVILDFAGVIGQHQPQADQDAMAATAGVPAAGTFWQAYWDHREDYDAGRSDAGDYWATVLAECGEILTPHTLDRLISLDVASWLHPNQETIELLDDLAMQGTNMALLSNCPRELAAALETLPWLDKLSRKFYSSHLSMVKPSPEIYLTVAKLIGVEPSKCVFVDDRPANVSGAEQANMQGIVFTDATRLREALSNLDGLTFDREHRLSGGGGQTS
jgi:putative hydrolase of the HAD superfamily